MKPGFDFTGNWFAVHPVGHKLAGRHIIRQRDCECGTRFTQYQLSERQCEAWEKADVMSNVLRQIPDLFVPVHCPPCESKDLGRQARIDEARAYSRDTYRRGA